MYMESNENGEFDDKYLPGLHNRGIRYYFYLNKGLDVLNQFRNLFLGILGLYIALHLDSWWLLIAMFVPSMVILVVVGYYSTHHLSKVMEWLNLRFSTHYGIKQFNYTQGQYERLEEIRDLLKDKNI